MVTHPPDPLPLQGKGEINKRGASPLSKSLPILRAERRVNYARILHEMDECFQSICLRYYFLFINSTLRKIKKPNLQTVYGLAFLFEIVTILLIMLTFRGLFLAVLLLQQ